MEIPYVMQSLEEKLDSSVLGKDFFPLVERTIPFSEKRVLYIQGFFPNKKQVEVIRQIEENHQISPVRVLHTLLEQGRYVATNEKPRELTTYGKKAEAPKDVSRQGRNMFILQSSLEAVFKNETKIVVPGYIDSYCFDENGAFSCNIQVIPVLERYDLKTELTNYGVDGAITFWEMPAKFKMFKKK